MYGVMSRPTLVAALLLFGISMTQCYILPHGVCRPNKVDIFPIDYMKVFSMGCWEIINVTKAEIFQDVDHACLKFTPNGNGTFTMIYMRVYKNGTVTREKSYNYFRNNIVFNEYVDIVTGEVLLFQDYPMDVTSNNAALFIRCSCKGGVSADVRYIAIAMNYTITKKDITELMAVNSQYDLDGTLVPLPRKLKKAACC